MFLTSGLGNAVSVCYKHLASLISAEMLSTAAPWPGLDVVYPFLFSDHPSNIYEEPILTQVLHSNSQSLHLTLSLLRQGPANYLTCRLHVLTFVS